MGKPDANGVAAFAFTSIAASSLTLQGTWIEVGSVGETRLAVAHTYTMPASSGTNGPGSQRDDTPYSLTVNVTRSAAELLVSGDARLAGRYLGLSDALGRFGTGTPRDAACAYQVASLGVQSSEVRIIGFGGVQMTQYLHPATYVGTVAGSVTVSVSISTTVTTTIQYDGFADQGGVVLTGAQTSRTDWGGSGSMSGTVGFALTPITLDPATVTTPITGSVGYGSVTLASGGTSGGSYAIALDGGASALVDAVAPPSPSAADCLNLP